MGSTSKEDQSYDVTSKPMLELHSVCDGIPYALFLPGVGIECVYHKTSITLITGVIKPKKQISLSKYGIVIYNYRYMAWIYGMDLPYRAYNGMDLTYK